LSLRDAAREHDDRRRALTFRRFVLLHAVVGAPGLALSVYALITGAEGTITPQGAAAVGFVVLVLAVLAFEVWFIAALAQVRHLSWLQDRDVSLSPAPSSPEPSG
jgi:membrane glycosyltransferase